MVIRILILNIVLISWASNHVHQTLNFLCFSRVHFTQTVRHKWCLVHGIIGILSSVSQHPFYVLPRRGYLRSTFKYSHVWYQIEGLDENYNSRYLKLVSLTPVLTPPSLISLLKVPRMVLLSSLLWWELGTSLPGHGPCEWLSFWRVTSKQVWFWPPKWSFEVKLITMFGIK